MEERRGVGRGYVVKHEEAVQLAGSGNGTPPCHRPITEHAGRARRQLPSDGSRRAVQGKRRGGGAGLRGR